MNPHLHAQALAFMGHAMIFDLDEAVASQTIALKHQFKSKTPDAIIAATALVNDLTVVTNNPSDFTRLGVKTIAVRLKPFIPPENKS